MPTQEKIDRVAELKDKLERSSIIISTGYSGMNANQMVDLRRRMRDGGVEFVVVKNSLLSRAADAAEIPQLKDVVTGQTAIALGLRRPRPPSPRRSTRRPRPAPARSPSTARWWAKAKPCHPRTFLGWRILPPRPILMAQLLGTMQSPIYGLASVLNATISSLAYVLQARIEQLQPAEATE